VPDPQDPATFERSKLTRRGSTKLRELYAALLRARRALAPGVDSIEFSEDEGWLRVRRGAFELACNFAAGPRTVPVEGRTVALATHSATLGAGGVRLPARAGALIER
jgi:maltooligosyltrehalose trehalohydrolase